MKRTVALKRNCCSLPDSKAQSNPGAMGTSESHPSSVRAPSRSQGRARAAGTRAASRAQRGRVGTSRAAAPRRAAPGGDCLILKRPNTRQKQAARSGAEPAAAQDGPAHAEETLGCGGCAGGGCACEVLLGAACWLESWDN